MQEDGQLSNNFHTFPSGGNNCEILWNSGYFLVHPSEYLTNTLFENRICSPNENNVLLPPKSPSSLSHILFWFCQPAAFLLVILKIIIIITEIINNFDILTVENTRVTQLKTFQVFQDLLCTSTNWSIPDDYFVWQFYLQKIYSFNPCVCKKYGWWHCFWEYVTNHCRRWVSHHWVLAHIHAQGPKYLSQQYDVHLHMWYIMRQPIASISTCYIV